MSQHLKKQNILYYNILNIYYIGNNNEKEVVIGGCGHIGSYAVSMLVDDGYDL